MGLDMYLKGYIFRRGAEEGSWEIVASAAETKGNPSSDSSSDDEEEEEAEDDRMAIELGYWRKHYDLNKFIINTFAAEHREGMEMEDGYCAIPLNAQHIHQIINAIENDALPNISGPAFNRLNKPGEEEYDERKAYDLEVFAEALDWLCAGVPAEGGKRCVHYEGCW